MTITIIGAGAIGGVIGAYLVRNGEKVIFVDKDVEHVNVINRKGLTIESKNEEFVVKAKAYTAEEFKSLNTPLETVILAVKAQHTREAINPILNRLGEDSFIVSMQNGLCEYEIANMIGKEKTVGCFVNLFADYLEPGKIQYGGIGSLYIGEIDGSISSRIIDLCDRLQCWGNAKVTNNIFGYLWSKLSYGAILTATATTNNKIADFFKNQRYHPIINAIGYEVLEVAGREGIAVESFDDWHPQLLFPKVKQELLEVSYYKLAKRLRGYTKTRTGIWRDLAVRKRKTEVGNQLNPVIKIGKKHGLEMPLLQTLVSMIEEIEKGDREIFIQNIYELESLIKS